jgi:hypothetical protein
MTPRPIIVGVTGHRDLRPQDIGELETLVRAFFSELGMQRSGTRIVVVSALADGADRLAARVACDLGLDLIAPLPMPRQLYELDFDDASKQDFAAFLSKAKRSFEIPIHPSHTEADLREPGDARTTQFSLLAGLLVERSDILLALWDGVPSSKPGGTADVVAIFRYSPKDPAAGVYHIVTPRLSNPSPAQCLTAGWLTNPLSPAQSNGTM